MSEQEIPAPGGRGAPRWLLPAVVAVIFALAGVAAVLITTRPARQIPAAQPAPAAAQSAPAVAQPAPADPPPAHGSLDPNGPQVSEIAVTEARTRFDAGSALFIDVRGGAEYAAGHIPGALTITSNDLDARLSSMPADAVIIAYGDAERPDSGKRGAQIFMDLGYPTVIALEGGFQAWQSAGNPVDTVGQ
jgi:rhodanese-related sulfurtransferase